MTVHKKSYCWGAVVTVSKGKHYKAVLHPEHIAVIKKLEDSGSTAFTDEQSVAWTAKRDGNTIRLAASGKSLSFTLCSV